MSRKSRESLKGVFKTNAVPAQSDFSDLLDSYYNYKDDFKLSIGQDFANTNAPDNGLLVQGAVGIGTNTLENGVALQVNGKLKLGTGSTTAIDGFSSASLANSSTTVVPTQSAVKTYVDTEVNQVKSSITTLTADVNNKANKNGESTIDFQAAKLTATSLAIKNGQVTNQANSIIQGYTETLSTSPNSQALVSEQALFNFYDLKQSSRHYEKLIGPADVQLYEAGVVAEGDTRIEWPLFYDTYYGVCAQSRTSSTEFVMLMIINPPIAIKQPNKISLQTIELVYSIIGTNEAELYKVEIRKDSYSPNALTSVVFSKTLDVNPTQSRSVAVISPPEEINFDSGAIYTLAIMCQKPVDTYYRFYGANVKYAEKRYNL